MSEPLAPEQHHGQPWYLRFDPCFNAPFGCTLGLLFSAGGVALIVNHADLPHADLPLVVLGALFCLWGAWWLYASFAQSYRRRLRLGIWPIAEPNSLEKIVELCKGPNPPIAVGECWAYLTNLQYAGPEERIIALGANWSGVVSMSDDTIRVRTGMLWGEVMKVLWQKNKAPMDRPAFDQMSIGASVRVAAHGFRKDGWFIDFLRAVQAVERGTGKVVEVKRGDYNWWKVVFGKEYIVTEAEFETQPNRLVFVTGQSQPASASTTQQEVDQWVQNEAFGWKDSPYVNMSIGGAAINRKWYTLDPVGVDEKTQSCLDYARRLVWADTPGIDSLGDAQTIIQQNFLISFYCGRQFLSISNVELFVKTEDGFDWDKIALFLVKFHAKYSGRTDLRERKRNGFTITAFDMVVNSSEEIPPWFEMLHNDLKITSGTLHPGKYVVADGGKIQLLDHPQFWIDASEAF